MCIRDSGSVAPRPSVLQRRRALPIGEIAVGAGREQSPYGLDMALAAIAEDHRLDQGRPAEIIAVSYTHLDVYKRQAPNHLIFLPVTLVRCARKSAKTFS